MEIAGSQIPEYDEMQINYTFRCHLLCLSVSILITTFSFCRVVREQDTLGSRVQQI